MRNGYTMRCRFLWYALLLHKLIKAIPSGMIEFVRFLILRSMTERDLMTEAYRMDPVQCLVSWLPHTHHLWPDRFKVGVFGC